MDLSKRDIEQLSQFENYLDVFKPTWAYRRFIHLYKRKKCLFSGNQALKTSGSSHQYVDRIMGWHPVPKYNVLYFECSTRNIGDLSPHGFHKHAYSDQNGKKVNIRGWEKGTWNVLDRPRDNICPYCGAAVQIHPRKSRIFRFAAESLPTDKESTGGQSREVKNSVYPEFKKWLPDFLIKREGRQRKKLDITTRNPAVTIIDPWAGAVFGDIEYPGHDIIVEFVSYNQTVQAGAGVQRLSVWTDEESTITFDEEQGPRLVAEDGDFIYTLTPANRMSWTFDSLFEEADLYFRTTAVRKFLDGSSKSKTKSVENLNTGHDIAVIQAATDDNPTLSSSVIEEMFDIADPDGTIIPTRRFGVFKQATGRVFKDFNTKTHSIDPKKYFESFTPEEMPSWIFARSQDWHPSNPHAIMWVGISPQNEIFVYQEWSPSPDRWTTENTCKEMSKKSGLTRFKVNLIDPIANTPHPQTTRTTIEEMNRYFYALKRDGGAGGYWEPYNTHGTEGRDDIKKRLANSIDVERPFNNQIQKGTRIKYLPTIWIFRDCKETIRSLKQWRYEEWADNRSLSTKERKEKPAQRYSHFCTALEGLLKDKRFKANRAGNTKRGRKYDYFQRKAA